MQEKQNNIPRLRKRFYFIGDHLAADWANTVRSPASGGESLTSWAAVVVFLQAAGAERGTGREPKKMIPLTLLAIALSEALQLRKAVRQILRALANRAPIAPQWVRVINRVLKAGKSYPELRRTGRKWRRELRFTEPGPMAALAPIALGIAELITRHPRARIRKCAHAACVLYFVDASRNGRRRWCSMASCGNRAKAAAHYRRQKSGS